MKNTLSEKSSRGKIVFPRSPTGLSGSLLGVITQYFIGSYLDHSLWCIFMERLFTGDTEDMGRCSYSLGLWLMLVQCDHR